MEVLNQPEDCTVFNQTVVVCTAPPQKWEVIQAIKRKNYELRICAYRPSDNRMSMNSFKFEYLPHVPTNHTPQNFQGPSGKFLQNAKAINSTKILITRNQALLALF